MGADQSAAEVFALLSDETRVDILRELARTQSAQQPAGTSTLSFSEIYDCVDVDNTSKLSYHLGELTGTFLRKDDEGYSFTHAGEQLVRFVLAENYAEPRDFGPEPVDGVCPFCGANALEARVNHQLFLVECHSCDRPVAGHDVAPAQVRHREGEQLVASLAQKHATMFQRIHRGLCPACDGRLSTTVSEAEGMPLPDAESFHVSVRCEECLRIYNAPMSYSVIYHPASIAFHWERGVDVTDHAMWEFHEYSREGHWRSHRADGDAAYEVTYTHDGDVLRLRLDEDASVLHTERVRRAGGADDN